MSTPLLRTPLYECHTALGARMVEYAGFDLPVQYQSVIQECTAVRTGAGMFDVSHMARLHLGGDQILEALEEATSNDVGLLQDNRGHYSLLPNAAGGTVDDIILYRRGPKQFFMVVNAGCHAKDVAHLQSMIAGKGTMEDVTTETAMIAVQGPKAAEIVSTLAPGAPGLADQPMFGIQEAEIGGVSCTAARSGYTGEDGFELICAASDAPRLWNALLEAGAAPCGLGSRDVLRVEAGLPLYGHELSEELSPIAAGLGWVISKTKSFNGSGPIQAAREAGTPQKLQGVRLEGKRLPLIGMDVLVDGRKVGEVSSGIYSPLLECGCAFAFVDTTIKQGTACTLEMRGKQEPAQIVNKRFFRRA